MKLLSSGMWYCPNISFTDLATWTCCWTAEPTAPSNRAGTAWQQVEDKTEQSTAFLPGLETKCAEEEADPRVKVQFRLGDAFQYEAVHPRFLTCRNFRSILSTETVEKVIISTEASFFYSKLHTLLIVLTANWQVDLGGKKRTPCSYPSLICRGRISVW